MFVNLLCLFVPVSAIRITRNPFNLESNDLLLKLETNLAVPKVVVTDILNEILTSGTHLDLTAYSSDTGSVTIARTDSMPYSEPLARVNFTRSFSSLGWNVAEVSMPALTSTSLYLAGYMEALVTAEEIGNWYSANAASACESKREILKTRLDEFVANTVMDDASDAGAPASEADQTTPGCPDQQAFKETSRKFWAQLLGMVDGFNYITLRRSRTVGLNIAAAGIQLPEEAILPGMGLMEFVCVQLEAQLSGVSDRCSAVVAVHEEEVMVAHSTWERPSEAMPKMFRMLNAGAMKMQFSSYPGMIWSSDDWMVKGGGLVLLETSLTLQSNGGHKKPRVPEFIKTMTAATLADTPMTFAKFMTQCDHNVFDFTNGEWLAVDLKTKGLVVVRQGQYEDKTKELSEHKTFGSFNGERSRRLDELNRAGAFTDVEELWNFFANNEVISPGASAADLKVTATSLAGSLVRAGPPPAAGKSGAYKQYAALNNVYAGKFDWATAPQVLMIEGAVRADKLV